ncbi:MAG: ornithine cyclodeaminase family protein [Flavobacteriales bacterium]|nr:ornithine cyclodeaminase family protein [Flavobacteriales bacterium]
MININKEDTVKYSAFPDLIEALKAGFQADFNVPSRSHHDMKNPTASRETTLLIMPAWEDGEVCGVKIVTVAPDNTDRPTIQGNYILIDIKTGSALALLDAPSLTARRTAAASALASSFLSREDTKSILMVGTGTLSPNLIKAHAAVRPIEEVFIWGRNRSKAEAVAASLADESFSVTVVDTIEEKASDVDLISVATMSMEPLIKGEWLKPGQHLDLVGAYRPDMRESDDEAIRRCRIYVDTYYGATHETGEIVIPLKAGTITEDDLNADLFNLCKGEKSGRASAEEITMFKSTGHALEDLAGARLIYNGLKNSK